jgi:hypothetical protein
MQARMKIFLSLPPDTTCTRTHCRALLNVGGESEPSAASQQLRPVDRVVWTNMGTKTLRFHFRF